MNRPTSTHAEASSVRMEQPSWHADGHGSPELGEYNSAHHAVAASAGAMLGADADGAHFPVVASSLWGYAGEDEPHVSLTIGGEESADVKMRLSEAAKLAEQLMSLVAAARASRRSL